MNATKTVTAFFCHFESFNQWQQRHGRKWKGFFVRRKRGDGGLDVQLISKLDASFQPEKPIYSST